MILDEFYGEFTVSGVTLQEALSVQDGMITYKIIYNDGERVYGKCEPYVNVGSLLPFLTYVRRLAIKHFEENGISFEELPK